MSGVDLRKQLSLAILRSRESLDAIELLEEQCRNTYGGVRLAHVQQVQHDVLSALLGVEASNFAKQDDERN